MSIITGNAQHSMEWASLDICTYTWRVCEILIKFVCRFVHFNDIYTETEKTPLRELTAPEAYQTTNQQANYKVSSQEQSSKIATISTFIVLWV